MMEYRLDEHTIYVLN